MISLNEAWKRIDSRVKPLQPRDVPIAEAWGCILSERLTSTVDVPNFASSIMDGVTLRVADLRGAGNWTVPLAGTIAAGDRPGMTIPPRHAARIMTGAPLPGDADTVIPVEDVEFKGDCVIIRERPQRWQFCRPRGDDIEKGQLLLPKGKRLHPVDTGALAAIGRAVVKVIPRPQVAVMSTGSEFISPGGDLRPGQRFNANDASLQALLNADQFGSVTVAPAAADELPALKRSLGDLLREHPVVISTGGVSMGDYDFVPQAAQELGGKIIFHRVAIKPGRPVLLARFDAGTEDRPQGAPRVAWLIGLPGNPVSVIVGYFLFVRRILARLMGRQYTPMQSKAKLGSDLKVEGDRLKVIGVSLSEGKRGQVVEPAPRQDSGRATSIKGIDGLIFIEEGDRVLKAGRQVLVEWI